MRRHPPWLAVVLGGAVIGLVFAAISTYDFVQHLDRQVHNLHCSFIPGVSQGGESGCQVAMMSPYSSVLRGAVWGGIPISLPAMSVFAFLAFYALDLLLTRRKGDPRATGLLALAATLPAATSLVMLAISLAELGTTCKLCVCIYVASALCLVGAVALWRRAVRERGAGSSEPDEDLEIVGRGLGRHHDEPAFVGATDGRQERSRGPSSRQALVAVVDTGRVSAGFVAGMVVLGVAFVALPVVLYLATAPDHARFIGTCEGLPHPDDSYGVMVRIEPARGGSASGSASGSAPVPAIEVLDPLCPACRAFEQRLVASGLAGRLDRKAVLFPLDSTCNWMVTEATHPGACTISEAVLCAGDRAPQVIAWALETQERIRSETAADPTAAARIVKQRFPELASCVGSPDARSRLNKSMRWIVANNIRVLTPQLFVNGVKLCDEDVDLGLEYTLSNMLERHARGSLAVVPLETAPGALPDAAGSAGPAAAAAAPADQEPAPSDRAAGSPPAGASETPATPASGMEKTPPAASGNAAPGGADGAPGQPASDGSAPGKPAADRPASDGAAPGKPADRPASDGAAPGKPAADRPSPDEPAPAPAPPAPAPERPATGSDQPPASPPPGPVTRPGDAP